MSDYEFPRTPEIEKAFGTAYRALTTIVPARTVTPEGEPHFAEVLAQFRILIDQAEFAVATQLGPPISWQAPHPDEAWDLTLSGIDLDNDVHDFAEVELGRDAFEGPTGTWHGSALNRAGMAYKRACRWDHPPGEAGVWLLMMAPVSASGGEDGRWFYSGHLTGFVVVYDRDDDGAYESVGHIWTATAWQRRGIARRLLTEARTRFPSPASKSPTPRPAQHFSTPVQTQAPFPKADHRHPLPTGAGKAVSPDAG